MPELPEVETVRRGLIPKLVGRRIAAVLQRRKNLRLPLPRNLAGKLTGRQVVAIDRRAKYLLIGLDDGQVLMVHLGMSGRMRLLDRRQAARTALETHDHVVIETDRGWQVRLNDPRRFGLMLLTDKAGLAGHKLLKGLGPEPLDDTFDGPALSARLKGKKVAVKLALLDQRVVAGVGNIYACEALFQAGISPKRPAGKVTPDQAARLAAAIKDVLSRSIEDGGSSLRDHVQPDGELGYFQTRFAVYDRAGQPCPSCRSPAGIKRFAQGGRSTFWCPACQK